MQGQEDEDRKHLHEDAAALGLKLENEPPPLEPFHLWPENVASWAAFRSVQTQWRTRGLEGEPHGLDYGAVLSHLQATIGSRRRVRALYEDILVLEAGALQGYAEARSSRKGRELAGGH